MGKKEVPQELGVHRYKLYVLIRREVKLTVVNIDNYHYYNTHMKVYSALCIIATSILRRHFGDQEYNFHV